MVMASDDHPNSLQASKESTLGAVLVNDSNVELLLVFSQL